MPRRNYPKKPQKTPYIASSTLDIAPTPDIVCREKRRFSTQKIAEQEIERKELMQPSLALSTYECPWCRKWHLTSKKYDN